MEFEAKPRKWGDSIGIIIPNEVVEAENIKLNEPETFMLIKKADFSKFRGTFKTKKTGQQLKDEAREAWNK